MANVLDYLLPKSFMTDVGATFKPKEYDFTSGELFGDWGGETGDNIHELYQEMRDLGYEPSAEFANWLEGLTEGSSTLMGQHYIDPDTGEETPLTELWTRMVGALNVAQTTGGPINDKWIKAGGAGGGAEVLPSLFGTEEQVGKIFEQSGLYDYEPGMASPLKLSQLRGLDPGAYTKQIETKRGPLADALTRKRQRAAGLGSGFAGYGERSFAEDLAEEQYETGVEDVYAGVGKERAGALQQLYADIDDYGQAIKAMQD